MIMSLLRRHIPLDDDGGMDEIGGSGLGKPAGGGTEVEPRMSYRTVRKLVGVGRLSHAATSPTRALGGGNSPHAMIGTFVGNVGVVASEA
jgi:hypothetical protein